MGRLLLQNFRNLPGKTGQVVLVAGELLKTVAGKNIDGIPVAPVKFLQDRPVIQGNDVAFNPYRSRGEMIDNEGNARNRRDDSHAQGHDFSPNVRGL